VEVTVEWQLDDTPVFDDGSELGRFGLKDGRAAGHLDRFGDIADLKHEVNLIDLAYLQFDAFTNLFGETRGLDLAIFGVIDHVDATVPDKLPSSQLPSGIV